MARVIVLDMDDTLYVERDFARSGFAAVADFLGDQNFAARAWELLDQGGRGDIFDRLAPDPSVVKRMVEVYRTHTPAIALAPDAARLLARVQVAGLITDGTEVTQRNKITALGIGHLDPVIVTDQWGVEFRKPHPRAFETVMARHGGTGADYVYVGDNPAKDFLSPRLLGWRTLRIRRPGGLHEHVEPASPEHAPDAEIDSLDALG
jgi:putative hydrolase of the HAD superfamily